MNLQPKTGDKKAIYQLTHADYDCSTDYYFENNFDPLPTLGEFQTLCDCLMNEAALALVKGEAKAPMLQYGSGAYDSWIGYDQLVQEVAARLPEHGFRRVEFPTVIYLHGGIIRGGEWEELHGSITRIDGVEKETKFLTDEALAAIIAHNQKIEDQCNKHREERRAKKDEQSD